MLLGSINEIKDIMPVGAANDFNRLKPHLQNAETAFIKPLLGTNMYAELTEFYEDYPYDNPTPVQDDMETLLQKAQHAIIHLAYFVGFDFLNASVTDMGFRRTDSEHSKSLFKYQEDNLRDYFKNSGYNMLDDILVFLEENITSFSEFSASATYTVFKQAFFETAAVFNSIYYINASRITFLRLQQHIKFVEDTVIKPLLGSTIYAEIKAGMAASPVPAKVVGVLPYIRVPLAYLSVAYLMEESGADLTDRGLWFAATMPVGVDSRKITPSETDRIAMLAARARSQGEAYLEMLKTYLTDNIADWTGYTTTQGSIFNRDNTGKKTYWA